MEAVDWLLAPPFEPLQIRLGALDALFDQGGFLFFRDVEVGGAEDGYGLRVTGYGLRFTGYGKSGPGSCPG